MNKISSSIICIIIILSLLLSSVPALGLQNSAANRNLSRNPRSWEYYDSITTTIDIDAGERFYIYFDNETMSLKTMQQSKLATECYQALNMVPDWLKHNLTYKFRQLSQTQQTTYANLIINSPDSRYIDEIAFCIAHTPVEGLKNQYTFPQLFTDNAKYIYENDQYLSYVDLVEKSDYTTISYKNKTGVSQEVPRDIYYWYVVHPKVSDELATYVDPDYDYTSHYPGSRNYGVSPPTGKFWREWFFYHNDTGQNISHPGSTKSTYKSNPLLKDLLMNATNLWDAISKVNNWISNSMIFNSNNERPVQPVRIYRKHMGRCGEHQDMRAAAGRAGLIPVSCVMNSAEDHVWNEYWDQRWIHWDGDRDNPMKYENGWGKTISSVYAYRGDSYYWSVTSRYSETCTYTATVKDSNGLPVDGAEVWVCTENYYDPQYLTITTFGVTDYTGKCTLELGDGRNYWTSADTENLGEDPPDSGGNEALTRIITNSVTGNNYYHTLNLPNAAPRLDVSDPEDAGVGNPYLKMDVNFHVESNILQGINAMTGEHCDYFSPSGNIDFFILDSTNFLDYNSSNPFNAYQFKERASSGEVTQELPDDDSWYAVLSNEFSQRTTKTVNITVKIYGKLTAKIKAPSKNSDLELDSIVTIHGNAFSPLDISMVEIDIDNRNQWTAATDISTTPDKPWWRWSYQWNTKGLSPGKYNIRARVKDSDATFITAIDINLLDVTPPMVDLYSPIINSTYKIGELITVSGKVTDNVGIHKLELVLNHDYNDAFDITNSINDAQLEYSIETKNIQDGEHIINILAYDTSLNLCNLSIQIMLLESESPVFSNIEPANNSVFELGTELELGGRITDNKKVTLLELKINDQDPLDLTSSLSKSGYFRYTWDTSISTAEAIHRIELTASDAVGNNASLTRFITLDGTPPVVNISTPVDNMIIKAGDQIIIEGYVFENIGVQSLDLTIDKGTPIDILNNLGYTKYRFNYNNTNQLASGEHTFTVKVTDLVGFTHETTVNIKIDTEVPIVELTEITAPVLSGDNLTLDCELFDDLGLFSLELDINNVVTESYTQLLENMTSFQELSIPLSTDNLFEGKYTITVIATDLVGNTGEDEININIITTATDTDGDGMPDYWELQYSKLDRAKDDSARDYDRDGFTNLEEYLGDDGAPGGDDHSNPMAKQSVPNIKEPKSTTTSAADYTAVYIGLIIIVILVLLILYILKFQKRKDDDIDEESSLKTTISSGDSKNPQK